MISRTYSASMVGLNPIRIEVEVDLNRGSPNLVIIGLPTKAVDESKERITGSLTSCGVKIRHKRTIVNLAPADIKKTSSVLDLAIAVGMLKTYGEVPLNTDQILFLGELALDGYLKPIKGALPFVMAAKEMGYQHVVLPQGNQEEVAIIRGIEIHPLLHLKEFLDYVQHQVPLPILQPMVFSAPVINEYALDFADVIGQEESKRALEIAAAGGHNILLNGPPGAGKSMMARTLASILPPMEETEALEVSKIYSVSGLINQGLIKTRPFRAPHHTTSQVGLIGGGSALQPGEISLAHRGILFLDELPEFTRGSLEALRQPLEDGIVTISRAAGTATYPARFSLVAAANPCPCGYWGSVTKRCECHPHSIEMYHKKISGPILDRIDVHVRVKEVDLKKMTTTVQRGETSASIRHRVLLAHQRQQQRYQHTPYVRNAEVASKDIRKLCQLSSSAEQLLAKAVIRYNVSARSYFKMIKVAQTIADLSHQEIIQPEHMAEAVQYRQSN